MCWMSQAGAMLPRPALNGCGAEAVAGPQHHCSAAQAPPHQPLEAAASPFRLCSPITLLCHLSFLCLPPASKRPRLVPYHARLFARPPFSTPAAQPWTPAPFSQANMLSRCAPRPPYDTTVSFLTLHPLALRLPPSQSHVNGVCGIGAPATHVASATAVGANAPLLPSPQHEHA